MTPSSSQKHPHCNGTVMQVHMRDTILLGRWSDVLRRGHWHILTLLVINFLLKKKFNLQTVCSVEVQNGVYSQFDTLLDTIVCVHTED